MYHRTIIVGRAGNAPTMRYTPDGTPVTSLSVAVNTGYGDKQRTIWYRVSCWRKTAEAVNQYVQKGALLLCEGELSEPKPYQGKDGEWRASLDLVAYTVKFLSSKTERQADSRESGGDGDEESIPF
jgi:single-strand DNA-binding protein